MRKLLSRLFKRTKTTIAPSQLPDGMVELKTPVGKIYCMLDNYGRLQYVGTDLRKLLKENHGEI